MQLKVWKHSIKCRADRLRSRVIHVRSNLPSMKVIWNNQGIAESAPTIFTEGNNYFPPHSIERQFFKPSGTRSVCL
ncbi:DUF427 domain-containing protein [Algoriphagus jejuensis]|uniref:DUF427 domain-containing protein n=1 Tax=Algoriphagus jejuensis TaxID=419934 RepID=UPI003CD0B7F4